MDNSKGAGATSASIFDGTNTLIGQSSYTPQTQQLTLSWANINAWIDERNDGTGATNRRQLIRNVSGISRPGQMLAIMGASGAGKTTLLNIISGRLTNYESSVTVDGKPVIEGAVQLNGIDVNHRVDILKRMVAFVEQDDVFPGFLTVEEHLWFHAKLRMTRMGTTDEQRRQRIDALMTEFNLRKVAKTMIGFSEMGMKTLSGGERKRLSVATELIANPPMLLLDEPTSGLDSFTSESVILALRQMAQIGKTVAFTIHQPSSDLFSHFDQLLLLSEGRVCYHGDAKEGAKFFEAPPLGRPCPISYNPADFYIEVLSRPQSYANQPITGTDEMTEMEVHATFISNTFKQSKYGQGLEREHARLKNFAVRRAVAIEELTNSSNYSNLVQPRPNAWTQLKWSTWRAAKSFYRTPQWIRFRFGQMIFFSVFYGIIYLNLASTPRGVMDRCGLMSQIISLCCWDNVDAYSLSLPLDRPFLTRDTSAGLYSLSAYFFGRQFVELPLIFGLAITQTSIISAMSGLWAFTTVEGAFQMLLAAFLTALNASSFGYMVGFLSDNIAFQISVRRILLSLMVNTNGFFLNVDTIPIYLRWFVRTSFFFYATESVFIAEWSHVDHLDCPDSSSPDFDGGRCFSNGREILDNYSYGDETSLKYDFIILVGMVFLLRGFALLGLYYRSYGSIWIATLKGKFKRTQSTVRS